MRSKGSGPSRAARATTETSSAGGFAALSLSSRIDGRAALRRLLEQIDLAEAMRRRAIQESIREVEVRYWLRRGADFVQVGTPDCDLIADNCRNHARLLGGVFGELLEPWPGFNEDLDLVLAERGDT
jgi:hypothetical protein